jgi:predicted nucleotidyltransferase
LADPIVPPELLNSVVAHFAPQRVILFGSMARGEAGPESDVDLLVVLDDDVPSEKLTAKAIHTARASVLRARARAIGSFAHIALREGVTIYERR